MGNCVSSSASGPLFDAIAGGNAPAAVDAIASNPALSHKRLGSQRRTAFHACANDDQAEVLKSICALVWRTVPDDEGVVHGDASLQTPGRRHPTILQAINAYDQAGLTPLMLACQKGHVQVVELLLLQGADPWIGDRLMGRSALHHAARHNQAGCIQAILSCPLVAQVGKAAGRLAESRLVDVPTNCGYAPLHYAAASRSAEAAVVLLSHGASPNAKCWAPGIDWLLLEPGSTPLHAAAKHGCLEVAMLLVKYFDDHLRRSGATDPRVVENANRVKPYQLPRARPDKALARVLDPATPIREISDPFGENEGAAAAGGRRGLGVGSSGHILVAPIKVAPLKGGKSSGLAEQDSDLSRLSYGSADGSSERAGTAPTDDAAARPPNRGAKLEAVRKAAGEFHVPSLPTWYMGGAPHPADQAAAAAAAPAGLQAASSSGLQVPPGWEDLLPADQESARAADSGQEKRSKFVSVYRAPEIEADAAPRGAAPGAPSGLTRGTSSHRVTPSGLLASPSPHLPATGSLPRQHSPPAQQHPLQGAPSSGRVPSDTAPAVGSSTRPAAAGARSSNSSSWGYDGHGPTSSSRVPSPNTELIPPPPAAEAGYPGSAPGLKRVGSGAAPPPAKPGSPEEARSGSGLNSGRSLVKALSKKLSSIAGSGTAAPAVVSAWGDAVSTPTKSTAAGGAAIASSPSGKSPFGKSARSAAAADQDCFTRDSHAADSEPVAITMFPYHLAGVERLKKGETFNRISESDSSRPPKQQPTASGRDGGAAAAAGAGAGGGGTAAASKSFCVSRKGLMATNDLSEDESRPEEQAPRHIFDRVSGRSFDRAGGQRLAPGAAAAPLRRTYQGEDSAQVAAW